MRTKPVLRWSRRRWIAETLKVKLEDVKPLPRTSKIPYFAVEGKTTFVRLPNDNPEDVQKAMDDDKTWTAQCTFVNPKVMLYIQEGA